MISSLLHLVGLRPRVYYTLTNFRGGGAKAPLAPPPSIHQWPYLQNNCNRELRQCLTKIRLSSHKFLVERGRWVKPQISYQERKCTLCGQVDVEDEYHVLLICSQYSGLRAKFIRKQFYVKPSMLKFQKLLTTTNSKDLQKLMSFIKLMFRAYNNGVIQH